MQNFEIKNKMIIKLAHIVSVEYNIFNKGKG